MDVILRACKENLGETMSATCTISTSLVYFLPVFLRRATNKLFYDYTATKENNNNKMGEILYLAIPLLVLCCLYVCNLNTKTPLSVCCTQNFFSHLCVHLNNMMLYAQICLCNIHCAPIVIL